MARGRGGKAGGLGERAQRGVRRKGRLLQKVDSIGEQMRKHQDGNREGSFAENAQLQESKNGEEQQRGAEAEWSVMIRDGNT